MVEAEGVRSVVRGGDGQVGNVPLHRNVRRGRTQEERSQVQGRGVKTRPRDRGRLDAEGRLEIGGGPGHDGGRLEQGDEADDQGRDAGQTRDPTDGAEAPGAQDAAQSDRAQEYRGQAHIRKDLGPGDPEETGIPDGHGGDLGDEEERREGEGDQRKNETDGGPGFLRPSGRLVRLGAGGLPRRKEQERPERERARDEQANDQRRQRGGEHAAREKRRRKQEHRRAREPEPGERRFVADPLRDGASGARKQGDDEERAERLGEGDRPGQNEPDQAQENHGDGEPEKAGVSDANDVYFHGIEYTPRRDESRKRAPLLDLGPVDFMSDFLRRLLHVGVRMIQHRRRLHDGSLSRPRE